MGLLNRHIRPFVYPMGSGLSIICRSAIGKCLATNPLGSTQGYPDATLTDVRGRCQQAYTNTFQLLVAAWKELRG